MSGDLENFIKKAQGYGAALLYAPDEDTNLLTNQGSLSLPDGQLKNGASLVTPGLALGSKAALLDGINDYIETGWTTRTNVIPNSVFLTGTITGWGSFSEAVSSYENQFGVVPCLKCVTNGNSSGGCGLAPDAAIEEGETYTLIVYVIAPNGAQMRARLNPNVGETVTETFEGKGGFLPRAIAVETTMAAGATTTDCEVRVNEAVARTFRLYGACLVKASKAELEEEYGDLSSAFFPFSAGLAGLINFGENLAGGDVVREDQLASGLCGWSGTEFNSPSDVGPFARGTKRTFMVYTKRTDTDDGHVFNNQTGFSPALRLTEVAGQAWFKTNTSSAGEVWTGWPAVNIKTLATVIHNDPDNAIGLYLDAQLVTRVEEPGQYDETGEGYSLRVGGTGSESTGFKGNLLPFAVFLDELKAEQIDELYRAASGLRRYSQVAIKQELPSLHLGLRIEPPGGEPRRWAEDEPGSEDVLSDAVLADEMPGGCESAGGTLARDPRKSFQDIVAFSKAYFYTDGIEKVWEGYFDKAPEVSGEHMSIAPALVGNQKHLEGDKAIQLGFINSDIQSWGDPTVVRQKQLLEAAIHLMAATSAGFAPPSSSSYAAVLNDFTNVTTVAGATEAGEAHHDARGIDIREVLYHFQEISSVGKNVDFETNVAIGTTDLYTTFVVGEDHDAATNSSPYHAVVAPTRGYRWARVRDRLNNASEGADLTRIFAWENLKVIGWHDLELQGDFPEVGFTAKQMLSYAVPIHASPLRIHDPYMDDDGYIVPHAWYPDQNMGDVVKDVTKYSLYDWFVYFDHLFQYREPGTYGRFWKAYVGQSDLEELGTDSERLWESIVVSYTDVDGTTRTVGPPGSGADTEDERLRITDTEHPAVRAELTRRDRLDLRGIGTAATAIAVGIRFLEEANLLSRSGSATLAGYVLDDKGVLYPASHVKSGDWISFVDASDRGYRKIVKKGYTHRDYAARIDVDAPPSGLDALLERLQADIIRLGLV